MVDRRELKSAIAAQRGQLDRDNARALGFTDAQIRWKLASKEWTQVARGLYRVTAQPDDWYSRMMAAQLRTKGVASHRAAASLVHMDGFDGAPPKLEVTTARDFRTEEDLIVHRTPKLVAPTLEVCGALLVTDPAWTLTDLGAVVPAREVEWALDWAVRKGWTTFEAAWTLAKSRFDRSGHKGASVLLEILRARLQQWTATGSILETIFLQLIRPLWIPKLTLQHPLYSAGRVIARADFACVEKRILIETLGNKFHNAHRDQLTRDCERENAIGLLRDWALYKFTWDQVTKRPAQTLQVVREIFAAAKTG